MTSSPLSAAFCDRLRLTAQNEKPVPYGTGFSFVRGVN